jgi:3-hydroxyacyl-CoA dehydrogenase/enoyl-CoA hydratase/3-hydroxybutyryl-CoA epimerase
MTMNELTHFRFEVDDRGVATVLLDRQGEAINTLGPAIFDDFTTIIDRLESDDSIKAVVLGSAKKDFLVGADIRWFGTLTEADAAEQAVLEGQALMNRLERLHAERGKPVIAAIHGAALGGGLELALCASSRICTDDPKTQLGQPEVQIGVLPAGGGTQRLPRLIGIAAGLDMILGGRPAQARKAKKLGLVDEVVPPSMLLEVARARALEAIGAAPSKRDRNLASAAGLQELALETTPVGRNILFKQARQRMLAETKGNYPAPEKALEAVRIGIDQGFDAGLAAEARFFGELVVSPESKALRSIFFTSREMGKETWVPEGVEAHPVSKVAVLGGGLMGGGIAAVSAMRAGSSVRVKEVDDAGVGRALGYVSKILADRVKKRRMSEFEAEKVMLQVTGDTRWRGFGDAELVIEAVFEDLELKRSILREVEGIVADDVVFASNTSTIPITKIAEASSRPETVLGMHYFSPVEKMPLLEIIVTQHTSDQALATAVAFGKRQGKTVIVVNDGTGFYTSRIIAPYSNEALFLLEEGASIEAIDKTMEAWGFPVGPLLLADEVGIDVGAKVSGIMIDAFGDRMKGPEVMAGLVTDNRKGRKNGRGFYLYDASGKRGEPDESVYRTLGLGPRREISREEIADRISLQMINEAARCLEEGILRSARDGDIGAVMGLGFPPFRGGPFFWVDQVGAGRIVADLERYADRFGPRFEPAAILRQKAEDGTTFR